MKLIFTPVDEADARQIMAWRYDEPYAVYNMGADFANSEDGFAELLDRRSPHYAVRDEQGELIGFCECWPGLREGAVCSPAFPALCPPI